MVVLQFREYLAAHGYDTSQMGLTSTSDASSVEGQRSGEIKEKAAL
jgi:hypothetical protein